MMKRILQGLLAAMLCGALAAVYSQGWEIAMLLLVVCGFSARAYRLAREYKEDRDTAAYDAQMKVVYGFTIACALISFYWPEDMYYNFVLLCCLLFHIGLNHYVRKKL